MTEQKSRIARYLDPNAIVAKIITNVLAAIPVTSSIWALRWFRSLAPMPKWPYLILFGPAVALMIVLPILTVRTMRRAEKPTLTYILLVLALEFVVAAFIMIVAGDIALRVAIHLTA